MVTAAQIATALGVRYEDQLANQIPRTAVLAQVLPIIPADAKNVSWIAKVGSSVRSSAGAVVADGADVSTFGSDTKLPASLEYGTYTEAFALTDKARAQAQASGNPAQLLNLFAEELEEALTSLAAAISTGIYTDSGADSDHMLGLLTASGGLDDTGTYAGINRALYTQWSAAVMSNGGVTRTLNTDLMRELRRRIYVACRNKPDLWVCSPLTHELYAKTFTGTREYHQVINLRGEEIRLDGGHTALLFDGVPVLEDASCPDGKMLALNTRSVRIRILPCAPDAINQGMSTLALKATEEEQGFGGPLNLSALLRPLSDNGFYSKFGLECFPQVQVRSPNWNGVIEDLPTS